MVEKAADTGEDSSEQVEVRKQKLEKLKVSGAAVYVNDFRPSHAAAALVAQYGAAGQDHVIAIDQQRTEARV